MSKWIDFKALRRDLNFETVLVAYGVKINARDGKNGRQHSGPCPLPACRGKPPKNTFSANLDRGIWQCFGCRQGGNTLDFIILMEGLDKTKGTDVQKAAILAKEKFLGGSEPAKKQPARKSQAEKPSVDEANTPYVKTLVNQPLDFQLQSLDSKHDWFGKNGFSPETVEHFGLGLCSRGWLKGRVAAPLHDNQGRLVGYAGRFLDEKQATDENPLYLFPQPRVHEGIRHEFSPAAFLYHRYEIERTVRRLLVTRKLEHAWLLWQHGYTSVVSIIGDTCSSEQATELLTVLRPSGILGIVSNESRPFICEETLRQIAKHRAMRWYAIPDGTSLCSIDAQSLEQLLGKPERKAP